MKDSKLMRDICFFVCCFFVFCFIGWVYETVWSSLKHGHFVNKGFLYGCYLPIYGFGGITLVLCLKSLMEKKIYACKVNITPVLVFLGAMIIISVIEFSVSYVLELIYHRRWWDYSKVDKIHLDGRVSLRNSTILTSGSMVFLYGVYPLMKKILSRTSAKIIVALGVIIVLVMGTDAIITFTMRY